MALHRSGFKIIYFAWLQRSLRKYEFLPGKMVMGIDGFFGEEDMKFLHAFSSKSHAFPLNFIPTCQQRRIFQVTPYLAPKEVAAF